jgi:hypothetical protein
MDVLDASTTLARVEEGLLLAALHSAYPARIWIGHPIFSACGIWRILRVVHDVWRGRGVDREVGRQGRRHGSSPETGCQREEGSKGRAL